MDQQKIPAGGKVERLSTVDKLRMLLDITKTISRSLDLEEVLNLVMDTLGSLLPYDAAGIYLIEFSDEDKSPYIFKSSAIRGYQISFELIEPRLKMGEGFLGTVAQTGKPIISHDVSKDSRYFAARELTRSEMVAPIISNDHVIGAFDLESDQLDAYSEDDLAILQLLTSQVAIIIEKVRLHEQVVEKKRLQAPSLRSPVKFSLSYCRQPIQLSRVLISRRIFSLPKRFREIITIGCVYTRTRSES
ncbi:MAG: GAF domain-containing protein [Chloracidobacterium sp.]|nr:GAF domain-containing protein [Chloracidobacterium sp.]